MASTLTPRETLTCSACNDHFELSRRQVKERHRRGVPDLCHACQHPHRVIPSDIAAMKRWWLNQYSLEQLQSWPHL